MADSEPRRVLLVEGPDDKHVVRRLSERAASMPAFCIRDKGGIDKLLASIPPEIKVSGRLAVGILADANDDPNARWEAVKNRLKALGFQPPASPAPSGTILPGSPRVGICPRVGIWLWPDNANPGEIEDFVQTLLPANDPLWPRAENYIDGIPDSDRRFKKGKALKAKIHAWLATRENPRLMGAAIGTRDLDIDGPLAARFAGWLRQLFA